MNNGSGDPEDRSGSAYQGVAVAAGAVLQQVAQLSGLLTIFIVVTLLARRLSPSEFGTYGLVSSFAGYLLIVRNSVASSAVKAMAASPDDESRTSTFSSAAALYAVVAAVTGILILAIGSAVAELVLSGPVKRQAQMGSVALGSLMALSILFSVNLDALRSSLWLQQSATLEILGVFLFGASMMVAIFSNSALWILIGLNGSLMLWGSVFAFAVLRGRDAPHRFKPGLVSRQRVRELVPTAGYLLAIEIATFVIYGLDRVILGLFRSPSAIAMYEGPIRIHNVFFALSSALGVTVLPATARLVAGDTSRLDRLLTFGSRYTLALVVPLGVTAMSLAAPLLEAWLGSRYRQGFPVLIALISYWLVYGALAVNPAFLVGAGKARAAAKAFLGIAGANLLLSLLLTPLLGVQGPALATALSYIGGFPFLLRIALSVTTVDLRDLVRTAWMPSLGLGIPLALLLVVSSVIFDLDSPIAVVSVGGLGLGLYWLIYFLGVLDREERALVRSVTVQLTKAFR